MFLLLIQGENFDILSLRMRTVSLNFLLKGAKDRQWIESPVWGRSKIEGEKRKYMKQITVY